MVAHSLLQAIARVNRVGGEYKDKGFVVDYVGIGHHLKKAIDTYDEREQKEIIDALSFPDEELRELEEAHAAVMALLQKHGLTDMSDHDAFYDVFYDEDLRFDFMLAFKRLTKSLNVSVRSAHVSFGTEVRDPSEAHGVAMKGGSDGTDEERSGVASRQAPVLA